MATRKPVVQEDDMGCGLACVAFVANVTYRYAQKHYFREKEPSKVGYYAFDLVRALGNAGLSYAYRKAAPGEEIVDGSIVFVEPSKDLPAGHYLVKTAKGWMDPWINWPRIRNMKAGFRKDLPGKALYVTYPSETKGQKRF